MSLAETNVPEIAPSVNLTEEESKRFWVKVDKSGECWNWTAGLFCDGYGHFCLRKKDIKSHRLSFLLSGGIITSEKPFVLHSCDNPKCVNPAHLRAGTHTENMKQRGERNRCSREPKTPKLTKEQVFDVLKRLKAGYKQREIAAIYNVTRECISCIAQGRNWKSIPR